MKFRLQQSICGATLALLFALCSPVWAAITIEGKVVLNHEKGAALSDVKVTAKNAISTKTDKDGHFALVFPDGQEGQLVEIEAQRTFDDTVVNQFELIRPLSAGASTPLLVILADKLEAKSRILTRWFYQKKVDQILKDKITPGKAAIPDDSPLISPDKVDQQTSMLRQAHALVLQRRGSFQVQKSNPYYNAALRLLSEANLDAALAQLSPENLNSLSTSNYRARNFAAITWLLRAHLLSLRPDFAAASDAYDKVLELLPEDLEILNGYGNFQSDQGNFAKAVEAYKNLVEVAHGSRYYDVEVVARMNMGVAQIELKQSALARKSFELALEQARDLAERNPGRHLQLLTWALQHLIDLNHEEKLDSQSTPLKEELLAAQRKLSGSIK